MGEVTAVIFIEVPTGVLVDVVRLARELCVQLPVWQVVRIFYFLYVEFWGEHNGLLKPVMGRHYGAIRLHLLGYCQWQVRATCVAHFLPFADPIL